MVRLQTPMGGAVSLIESDALEKFLGRELGQIVHQPLQGYAAPYAVYQHAVLVLYDRADVSEQIFQLHKIT